jgi:ubiquinone/menaquinone biosynthesis C-methylase UbiE
MILNLGCGYRKEKGEIGVDRIKTPEVDIIADAHYLPFKDNSFKEVKAYHVLEHLDFLKAMDEIHRVLEENGILHAKVPHAFSPWYFDNPTHKTPFTSWSLKYYTDWNEFQRKNYFEIIVVKLNGKFSWFLNRNICKFEKIFKASTLEL